MKKKMPEETSRWKLYAALLLFIVTFAGAALYIRGRTAPPSPENASRADNPERGGRPEPPTPEEREEMFKSTMNQLNLTQDQQKQIEKLGPPPFMAGRRGDRDEDNRETRRQEFGEWREKMGEILTEEQQEKLRSQMRRRFSERRNQVMERLSPQDQEALRRRFENRFGGMGDRPGGPPGERRAGGDRQQDERNR